MKIEEATNTMKPIAQAVREKGDAFFCVFFSREQDKWAGTHLGLDSLDLGIVIEQFFARVCSHLLENNPPDFVALGTVEEMKKRMDEVYESVRDSIHKARDLTPEEP
jgi:hypothetical protein